MFYTPFFTCQRALFVIPIVLSLAFLRAPGEIFAKENTTAQVISGLEQAAQECLNQKDYSGAREKYLQVLHDYPDAIWSQYGLICIAISLGDFSQAQSEAAKLLANYAGHPDVARAVQYAASDFRRAGHDAQAVPLYQAAAANWPTAEEAIWSQWGLTVSQIKLGDFTNAKIAADKLLSDYSADPEIAKAVQYAADDFLNAGHYAEAVSLYQAAATNWPTAERTFWSLRGQICSQTKLGDFTGAKTAANKLLSDYASHADPDIASALQFAGDDFRNTGHDTEAIPLYQAAVANWPTLERMIWGQWGLIHCQLQVGDVAGAKASTDKLLTDYSTHPEFAKVVRYAGDEYHGVQRDEEALVLYQGVLGLNPSMEEANNAHSGIARVYLARGDEAAVHPQIDFILGHYDPVENGVIAIFEIGEEYNLQAEKMENRDAAKGYYQKSIDLFENHVLAKNPEDALKSMAYYIVGLNYLGLKDYAKAADAFANSYQRDPGFKYADYCLFARGDCYKKLMRFGTVSEPEAKSVMTEVYSELTSKYSESPYRRNAKSWLEKN